MTIIIVTTGTNLLWTGIILFKAFNLFFILPLPVVIAFSYSKVGLRLSKEMICRVCARNGCLPLSTKIYDCDIMGAIRSLTNINVSTNICCKTLCCVLCFSNNQMHTFIHIVDIYIILNVLTDKC